MLCSAATLCTCASAAADIIYVSADGDDSNGSSWGHAYTDLQAGLAAAAPGDEVWVKGTTDVQSPAIYKPGANRSDSFVILQDRSVYGGFAGTEGVLERTLRNEFAHPTYLDGDIGTANDASDNSYHVVTIDDADHLTTKLSGFTIRNGNANASSGTTAYGGGIYVTGSTFEGPSLDRLVLSGNKAKLGGGGVYSDDPALWLTNCRFEFNEVTDAAGEGGGLSLQGTSFAQLQNCVFYSNSSGGIGGGACLTGFKESEFFNCTFHANTATGIELSGSVRYGHSICADFDPVFVRNSVSSVGCVPDAPSSLRPPN